MGNEKKKHPPSPTRNIKVQQFTACNVTSSPWGWKKNAKCLVILLDDVFFSLKNAGVIEIPPKSFAPAKLCTKKKVWWKKSGTSNQESRSSPPWLLFFASPRDWCNYVISWWIRVGTFWDVWAGCNRVQNWKLRYLRNTERLARPATTISLSFLFILFLVGLSSYLSSPFTPSRYQGTVARGPWRPPQLVRTISETRHCCW